MLCCVYVDKYEYTHSIHRILLVIHFGGVVAAAVGVAITTITVWPLDRGIVALSSGALVVVVVFVLDEYFLLRFFD